MKKLYESGITFFFLIAVFLSLTVCQDLFLPELLRTNPFDEDSVVAPVEDLEANVLNGNTIELTWKVPDERKPSTLIIVKTETQNPDNPNDGTRFDGIDPDLCNWQDTDVFTDVTYYYGIWSVAADGTKVGPIYTLEEIILQTYQFEPDDDGYADDSPATNFISTFMDITRAANVTQAVALIRFDLTLLPATIETAELELQVTNVATSDSAEIFKITQTWDPGSITWAQASAPAFYNSNPPIDIFLPVGPATFTINVRDAILEMRTGNNYGFLIRPANVTNMDIQIGTIHGSNSPYLTVAYYDEKFLDD